MRAPWALLAVLALHGVTARAQTLEGLRPETRDTARPGERIRVSTAPAGPWQPPVRLMGASADSVALGATGLTTSVPRGAIQRVQVSRRSGARGAKSGGLIGASVGLVAFTAAAAVGCGDGECEGGSVATWIATAVAFMALPAGVGAGIGAAGRRQAWKEAALPAGPASPVRRAHESADSTLVSLFTLPDTVAKRELERLRERLVAAGVAVRNGHEPLTLAGPGRGPTQVRYFSERDRERAEALAFWLGRVLSRTTATARQVGVPAGELHVWVGR